MRLLDLTLATPEENLALDEALLLEAEAGNCGEVLRFWEWPNPAVILGAGCRVADDVEVEACQKEGVPILRRSSGGGTVLLNTGCLCFSLVLRYDRSPPLREILPSYVFILHRLLSALHGLLPDLAPAGTSDLVVGTQKLSGNAQQRKRTHLLHHGTLLVGMDLPLISRYLRLPPRQPEYRQQRPHEAFLTNLPCDAAELKERLTRVWQALEGATSWPAARVAALVEEKYSKAEWNRRR